MTLLNKLIAKARRTLGKTLRQTTRKGEKFDNNDLKIKYLTVTIAQLWQIFFEFVGYKNATIEYLIEPDMYAEGWKKYPNLRKFGYIAAGLGTPYTDAVNRQRERENIEEPEFQAQPIWKGFGMHISRLCVIHVLKLTQYLQYKQLYTRYSPEYVDITTGKRIDASVVKPYLKPFKPAENQGVEETIHMPVVKLENIVRIKTYGITFIVSENEHLISLRKGITHHKHITA